MNNIWTNATVLGPADNFYSLTDPRLSNLFRYQSSIMGYGSGTPTWLTMNTPADYLGAWEKCPPLVSIICGLAQADINGRVAFFRGDEEVKPNGYNKEIKALSELFTRPNPLQTWRQFRAQQKIYKLLFGICPVLKVKPVGFDSVRMMWNIPPHITKIKTSGKLYYQSDSSNIITQILVTVNGIEKELPVNDVFFLRDQTVSLQSEVLPDSRLKTLSYPITNIVAAYEAANVLITKRGALGIFSNSGKDQLGTTPVDPTEKAQLLADLNQYGLSHEQSQYIVTAASLTWQQIGVNAKELMLLETIADSTMQICDVYGFPYELLANAKGVTFANKKEAKASLYQDTVVPSADADMEVYAHLMPETLTGVSIRMMFDHVEVLQKSEKEAAEGREATNRACMIEWEAGKLTLNDWQVMVGGKKLQGEQFDLYKPQYDQWLRDNGLMPDMGANNEEDGTKEETAGQN